MSTTNAPAPPAKKDERRIALRQFMGAQKVELVKLLPPDKVERLVRVALTECVRNPQLVNCTAESWALALNACAAWGLYPDSSLGYVYLIPRENRKKQGRPLEVQAMRGYQGDIQLARNTGEIADLYVEVVYEKDEYRVTKGLNRDIHHVPYAGADDPGPLKAVYAVAKLKDGSSAWVDLTKRDVMRHKAASESAGSDYSPWSKHEAAMWKKSAIRELVKWLPRSSERIEEVMARLNQEAATEGMARPGATVTDIEARAIESSTIPLEDQGDALDRLADQVGGGREPGADDDEAETPEGVAAANEAIGGPVRDCKHPGIPQSYIDNMPAGEEKTCTDCGTIISGPGRITREKEEKAAKKPSGQSRLS